MRAEPTSVSNLYHKAQGTQKKEKKGCKSWKIGGVSVKIWLLHVMWPLATYTRPHVIEPARQSTFQQAEPTDLSEFKTHEKNEKS